MPAIKVNTSKLKNYEADISYILKRVNNTMMMFDSTARNLDWNVRAEERINYILSKIGRELEAEAKGINDAKKYLGTAVKKYNDVENKNTMGKNNTSFWDKPLGKILKSTVSKSLVVGTAIAVTDVFSGVAGVIGNSKITEIFKKFPKNFSNAEVLEKMTNIVKNGNKVVGNTRNIINETKKTYKVIKSQKKIIDLYQTSERNIGRAKQVIKEAKSDWIKKMAGTNESIGSAAQSANSFINSKVVEQSWKARFSDHFSASIKSSTKKLVKPAGIVTTILTVISSGISNYSDWKAGKMSGSRAVAETLSESAVSIGTDLVVGAAVTAGCVAAFGSAPVLLVGAATVAVSIGADSLCKYITKNFTKEKEAKGLTETVSDLILDAGERKIKDDLNKAVKVYNVGSRIVSAVCGG